MVTSLIRPMLVLLVSAWLAACGSTSPRPDGAGALQGREASGAFAPAGPPPGAPVRIPAGDGCIVDLTQPYTISGTLSGALEVDFRIFVDGPCGVPPGTFDEHWIAHGTFSGTVDGKAVSAGFSYTATVQAGGDVDGTIVLGQGMGGELRVRGTFGDGRLGYEGWTN